jgi:acyl carrier protein
MTTDEIRAAVLASLAEVAPEADPAAIDPAVPLQEQLDLDSMDFLAFLAGVADLTGVEVPERDYEQVAALQGCVDYVAATRAAA